MEIVSLLYVLCVIPIAGIISAVIMLIKDVHKYRKSFLKRLMITAVVSAGDFAATRSIRKFCGLLDCWSASDKLGSGRWIRLGLVDD